MRKSEACGDKAQTHFTRGDNPLHEGHGNTKQHDADEEANATRRVRTRQYTTQLRGAHDLHKDANVDVSGVSWQSLSIVIHDADRCSQEASSPPDSHRSNCKRFRPSHPGRQVLGVALVVPVIAHGTGVDCNEEGIHNGPSMGCTCRHEQQCVARKCTVSSLHKLQPAKQHPSCKVCKRLHLNTPPRGTPKAEVRGGQLVDSKVVPWA
mmetsp:Transcript_88689/g.268917  ORF Transcript_88689/g.268917 Transcript_88689/m.268917 type:complete len:208 (-) Transcript_88689:2-625(-)